MTTSLSINSSPLDVEGIDTDISIKEILQFIHESRRM